MSSALDLPVPATVAPSAHASATVPILAMAVGGFGIGTGEFAIMGLLPEVAADIGVSIPQAGHVISAYALGVVVGAPLLAVLTARWPRRALMVVLMALFAIGNFASALAPGYLSLNALRFLTGLPHGTFFGTAALVASSASTQAGCFSSTRAMAWRCCSPPLSFCVQLSRSPSRSASAGSRASCSAVLSCSSLYVAAVLPRRPAARRAGLPRAGQCLHRRATDHRAAGRPAARPGRAPG